MQVSHVENPPGSETAEAIDAATEQRPHRILIVDDEPTLRFGFGIALSTEGFEIEEAEDGDAAIRAITSGDGECPFDAMVLDLRMPGKSGIDVLRALGEEGIVLPAVIVSAFIDSPTAVEAIEWGAVDFLQKPTKPDELRGVVNELIAEEAQFDDDDRAGLSPEATIASARRKLRRRRQRAAFALLKRIDAEELPIDGRGRLQLSLWRMIAGHLSRCKETGGKTEFASSRFYEATDLLKYLAYNSG